MFYISNKIISAAKSQKLKTFVDFHINFQLSRNMKFSIYSLSLSHNIYLYNDLLTPPFY